MVEVVLLNYFVVVKVFLLELLKNYLESLEEMGRDVSLSLSMPKVLECIWHFVLTQGMASLAFFFFFLVYKHTVNSNCCDSF